VEVCGLELRRVVNGIAILQRAHECPGEALCQVACPTRALSMQWVELDESDSLAGDPP
jgi:formate hydrogenlyase subunit 6/NADH:ubiquinone oxidoreductase subunit I